VQRVCDLDPRAVQKLRVGWMLVASRGPRGSGRLLGGCAGTESGQRSVNRRVNSRLAGVTQLATRPGRPLLTGLAGRIRVALTRVLADPAIVDEV
jgi:hypothetical protein